MTHLEAILSICLGVGLAAASGFRVFVPLLGMSLAAQSGHLPLSEELAWIGSPLAIAVFAAATVVEVAGYYIPWIDHLLDTIAGPAAVVAGILATAAVTEELSPSLRWLLATIAGGGTAGATKSLAVIGRAASTVTTGGLGNFIVSTIELILSIVTTILAIVVPVLAAISVAALLVWGMRLVWRRWQARRAARDAKKVCL